MGAPLVTGGRPFKTGFHPSFSARFSRLIGWLILSQACIAVNVIPSLQAVLNFLNKSDNNYQDWWV
jgi:hypothetical protein